MKTFYLFWSTQTLSQFGSTMTNFALTLWLYQKTGSALKTALLMVSSYAPYVLMSIFAGALSDKWDKKKTMLVCDTLAACCTLIVLVLLKTEKLLPWHMYLLNAINGLMGTVQSPASDVTITLITTKDVYQKTSGLRAFSNSLNTILHPVLATTLYAWGGMDLVIGIDLATYIVAFVTLAFFIKVPKIPAAIEEAGESLWQSVKSGLGFLKQQRLVLMLILFLAGVNFVASAFDAVLPAFVLPRANGGEKVLGYVTSAAGIAMLVGSMIATTIPKPKNRIRVIYLTMLVSLTTDNFLMSLTSLPVFWCIAQVFGYLPVPLMNTNLDVIVRSSIPPEMQGRVYACRNTLQFFTIPIGYLLGGVMVDTVCEPIMAAASSSGILVRMFGSGQGAGAGMMIFILGWMGMTVCLVFRKILKKYRFEE